MLHIFQVFFLSLTFFVSSKKLLLWNICISCTAHVVVDSMEGFFACHRESDKLIFDRLQKEFEAARAAQTKGTFTLDFFFQWPLLSSLYIIFFSSGCLFFKKKFLGSNLFINFFYGWKYA